jgi:transglutaminase-like putative cysteine protease
MKIVWPKDAKDLTCVAAVPPTILAHTVTSASMTLGTGNYTVNTQIIPTDTLLVPNALYARLDPNRVPSRRIDATIMAEAIVNSTKIVPGAINEQAPPLLPADHELLTQSLDPADLEKKFKGWLKENKLIRWSDETEMAFVYRIYCWCQRNCRYTWGSWGGRPSKHAGHFGTVESQTGTCGELAFIMIHILRTNGIPCTMAQGTGHVYVLVYVVGSGWFRIDQPSAMYGYHKGNLDNGIGFDWGPFIHDTHDYPRKYFFPDGPQEGRVFGDVEVCPAWTITEIK